MHSKKNRKKNAKQLKIKSNEMKDIYIYIYIQFFICYIWKKKTKTKMKNTQTLQM